MPVINVVSFSFHKNKGIQGMKLIKRKQDITQLLDDNEVILARSKFVVEVERLHGKVPQVKVKQATDLKVPLLAIAMSVRIQADHARKRLEALNAYRICRG